MEHESHTRKEPMADAAREHRHYFVDPVVLNTGGINYRCTTPLDGGKCPDVEFHPPNADPLIQAIIVALYAPEHYGMYINRFADNDYDIEGMVDMAVVAAALRSKFSITPLSESPGTINT